MDLVLDQVETRVLGALMEKEMAIPDYYPMTLNALVNACNQKSNREPVMSLDESAVEIALQGLREKRLATRLSGAGHRVQKYGHRMGEAFNFDRREEAVLCVLMLRGPQTVGELRGRTERMYHFDDLEAVEHTLRRLMERESPLAVTLPRRPGEKEPRHAHLLAGEIEMPEPSMVAAAIPATVGPNPLTGRVEQLEKELSELRQEFDELKRTLQPLLG
jgi:uncharacterized protein YceH (UPF0502 family)